MIVDVRQIESEGPAREDVDPNVPPGERLGHLLDELADHALGVFVAEHGEDLRFVAVASLLDPFLGSIRYAGCPVITQAFLDFRCPGLAKSSLLKVGDRCHQTVPLIGKVQ